MKGNKTPSEPLMVAYRRASEPPGISVALCNDVTVSPTWKFTVISPFCDAPFNKPVRKVTSLIWESILSEGNFKMIKSDKM